jgi:hypothetical protein
LVRIGSGCLARLIWRRGAVVGATTCHWASSAGDVRPRGGELLLLVGRERAWEQERRQAQSWVGPACASGLERRRRPGREKKMNFLFIFQITGHKNPIFEQQKLIFRI